MKFNRDSWHYKLFLWGYRDEPRYLSLCEYFWRVITVIPGSPLLILRRLLSKKWWNISFARQDRIMNIVIYLSLAFATIIWVLVVGLWSALAVWGAVGVIAVVRKLVFHFYHPKQKFHESKVNTDPNILWEYLKAKKNRVCPIIEWI